MRYRIAGTQDCSEVQQAAGYTLAPQCAARTSATALPRPVTATISGNANFLIFGPPQQLSAAFCERWLNDPAAERSLEICPIKRFGNMFLK
jgi:hypothetical protein